MATDQADGLPNLSKEEVDDANANVHQSVAGATADEDGQVDLPPTGPTGPTSGDDAAAPSPSDPAEAVDAAPVEPETTTGPAQEPVHYVAEPAADPDAMAEQDTPPAPAEAGDLDDAELEAIEKVIRAAHQTLGTATYDDVFGRRWTAMYEVSNNMSVVKVSVEREGGDTWTSALSTAGLSSDGDLKGFVASGGESVK